MVDSTQVSQWSHEDLHTLEERTYNWTPSTKLSTYSRLYIRKQEKAAPLQPSRPPISKHPTEHFPHRLMPPSQQHPSQKQKPFHFFLIPTIEKTARTSAVAATTSCPSGSPFSREFKYRAHCFSYPTSTPPSFKISKTKFLPFLPQGCHLTGC